jgi:hypothetical protein
MTRCINNTNTLFRTCCESVTLQKCHVKCCIYVLPNRCSNITLQICHVNVANMFSDKCCRNVTVTEKPHKNRHKCHSCTNITDPHQWKMTPPVENDPPRELETPPVEIILDPTEGITYCDSYNLTPHRGNYGENYEDILTSHRSKWYRNALGPTIIY